MVMDRIIPNYNPRGLLFFLIPFSIIHIYVYTHFSLKNIDVERIFLLLYIHVFLHSQPGIVLCCFSPKLNYLETQLVLICISQNMKNTQIKLYMYFSKDHKQFKNEHHMYYLLKHPILFSCKSRFPFLNESSWPPSESIDKWKAASKYIWILPGTCDAFLVLSSSLFFIWKTISHEWLQQVADTSWKNFDIYIVRHYVFIKFPGLLKSLVIVSGIMHILYAKRCQLRRKRKHLSFANDQRSLPNLFKLSLFSWHFLGKNTSYDENCM